MQYSSLQSPVGEGIRSPEPQVISGFPRVADEHTTLTARLLALMSPSGPTPASTTSASGSASIKKKQPNKTLSAKYAGPSHSISIAHLPIRPKNLFLTDYYKANDPSRTMSSKSVGTVFHRIKRRCVLLCLLASQNLQPALRNGKQHHKRPTR